MATIKKTKVALEVEKKLPWLLKGKNSVSNNVTTAYDKKRIF